MKKFEEGDIFVNKIKTHPKVKFFCYDGKIYQNNTLEESVILNNFLPEPPASSVVASVVEDGLVVHLDASNASSYSGTGPTWYDLTSNNADFNLENSPTYNASNGGYFEFNGSNQAASSPSSTGVTSFDYTDDYSVEIWYNPDVSQINSDSWIVSKWVGSGDFPYGLRYRTTSVQFWSEVYDSGTTYRARAASTSGSWVQNVSVYDWSNDQLMSYIDGNLASSVIDLSLITTTVANSTSVVLGRRGDSIGHFKGGVAIFRIYDKALSSTEILQNYNANKDRFGL
jgi:hypothetical protein